MQFSARDITAILRAVGSDAVLTDQNGATTTLRVKHSPAGSIIMGMITETPVITCAASALDGVELKTAKITLDGVNYRMLNPLPDGSGFITCNLTKL